MSIRISCFVALSVLISACGTHKGGSADDAAPQGQDQPASDNAPFARLYDSATDLPPCTAELANVLAYVSSEKAFRSCSGTVWVNVDLGGASSGAGTSLVKIDDEPAGANCKAGGKAVHTGVDKDVNGTLATAEVVSTGYICNGSDGAKGADGNAAANSFNVVATYAASGDGTNLCDKYAASGDSCFFDAGQVDVFANGYWQVRLVFDYLAAGSDIADREGSFILPKGETTGAFKLLSRFIFRNDGSGGDLWAVITKDKSSIKIVHDTDGDYVPNPDDDLVIAEYPLTKVDD